MEEDPSLLFRSKLPAAYLTPLCGSLFPLYRMAHVEGTIITAVMVVMTVN